MKTHNKIKFRRVASRESSNFSKVVGPEDINIFRPRFPGLMKNKKGFIRIIEAIFAILIIMGAVLIIISKNVQTSDISEQAYEKQRYILEIIANNEQMREQIINNDTTLANEFIRKNLPESWNFETCIEDIDRLCNPVDVGDRDIYVSESIISSSLTTYTKSKKLRFFIWR